MGRYRDGHEADISDNANTISVVIDTRSFDAAIERMQWWKKHRPKSGDEDYKSISSIVAWIRPNSGPGNKRSHKIKGILENWWRTNGGPRKKRTNKA
jgi:hypothetical protein